MKLNNNIKNYRKEQKFIFRYVFGEKILFQMRFHEIHFNFTSLIIAVNKSRHQIRAWLESDFSSWFTFLFGHHLLPYYVMQQTAAPIAGMAGTAFVAPL